MDVEKRCHGAGKILWTESSCQPPTGYSARGKRDIFGPSDGFNWVGSWEYKLVFQEAKARLSSLVARAEAGEEVVIARANRPSVRLVPIQMEGRIQRLGEAKALVHIHDDFDVEVIW